MNKQETFDYVVRHLYEQGKPALNDEMGCMYRTENGLMCAVGCLIPDSMYDKEMEFKRIDAVLDGFTLPAFIKDNEEMLFDLQTVHDKWRPTFISPEYPFTHIEGLLKEVAEGHSVVYNKPY